MANGAGYRQMIGNVLVDSPVELAKLGFDDYDVQRLVWRMLFGSQIRLVSNCEEIEDWDVENSTHFNGVEQTTPSTDYYGGSTSLELATGSGITEVGTAVTMDEEHRPDNENWDWASFLCFWIHDDTTLRAGTDLIVQIRNAGVWQSVKYVPTNAAADIFEYKVIDIRDWDRDRVDGFRFVNNRLVASKLCYVDEIIVTDLVAGRGNGVTIGVGPVRGPVRPYRMETGSIRVGDAVNLENGLATKGVDADVGIIGLACSNIGGAADEYLTATDANPKEVWVAVHGSIVIMRNGTTVDSGDNVVIESGDLTTEVIAAGAEAQETFARHVGRGTDTWDDYYKIQKGFAEN